MAFSANWRKPVEEPLSTEDVLRAELEHVLGDPRWADRSRTIDQLRQELHALPDEQRPSALCLSGGGIRSATFCLGVLQWLAKEKKLKEFHYLSTVSGGGYIGSWLVNGLWQAGKAILDNAEAAVRKMRSQAAQAASSSTAAKAAAEAAVLAASEHALRCTAAADAAAASDKWLHRVGQSAGSVGGATASGAARATGSDPVAPLRAFSNYLSPTGGLSGDAFSLVAIFVRNLLLNALVWLSLLAAAVALPRLYIALLGFATARDWGWIVDRVVDRIGFGEQSLPLVVWLALLTIVIGVAYIVADLPAPRDAPPTSTAPSAAARQAAATSAQGSTARRDRFTRYCFWPIVLAAIFLSIAGAWITALHELPWWTFAVAGAIAHWVGVVCGLICRRWIRRLPMRRSNPAGILGVVVVGLVGAFGGALAFVALRGLALGTGVVEAAATQRLLYATFAVPAMAGAFWLSMALYAGLMGRFTDEQDREWWARATGLWLRFSVLWVLAFALVVWLPLPLLDYFGAAGPTALQFGVGGGVLGVLTSLIGYWSHNGAELQRKAKSVLRAARIKLLDAMAALVVVATLLSLSLVWSTALDRCHDWRWTARLCTTDLHAQTEFIREQARLRLEHTRADKRAADASARAEALAGVVDDVMADGAWSASAQAYRHVLLAGDGRALSWATAALLALAAGLALAMGVNVFSLHGMYGNRLVRAYLGSGRAQRRPHWFTGFDPDDNPSLAVLEAPLGAADKTPRLYPVINIALNIVQPPPDQLDWQQRKAAPFIATPKHCGGDRVGYRPTASYAGGMSLGRALTISGAAASPNMGYHSSAPVTFVMAMFNVRLGWWSPNPGKASGRRCYKDHPGIDLKVAVAEATGRTGADDPVVYLSDGGHFDNLGIYEMVRRRCRRIVAVDATCDGSFEWHDLLDAVRKIRVDLGIPIELPAPLPGPGRNTPHPRRVEAPIRYSARDSSERSQDGTLIVLKPRLLPDDPPELAAYAAASAAEGSRADDPARFPHQTTADQFFDEQQFESYRLLGYTTAAHALCAAAAVAAAAPRRVRARAAAALAPAAPARNAETAADAAGTGGLGYLVHQMGSNAALATALTLGGTLGIAGTVALAPTELKLSETDRSLLKDGIALRADAATVKLNDADRTLLGNGIRVTADGSALYDPAKHLSDAAERLYTAAEKLPTAASGADASVRIAINNLNVEISQLRRQVGGPRSGGVDLTSAVDNLRARLVAVEEKLPKDAALTTALDELKNAVNNIAPRRNVRGQEGGTR